MSWCLEDLHPAIEKQTLTIDICRIQEIASAAYTSTGMLDQSGFYRDWTQALVTLQKNENEQEPQVSLQHPCPLQNGSLAERLS